MLNYIGELYEAINHQSIFYPEQFRVSDVSFKQASMGHDITVLADLPNYLAGRNCEGQGSQFTERKYANSITSYRLE